MAKNTKITKTEKIVCKCYGKEQEFTSRKKAIDFYLDCMMNSDGAERDRYTNIYLDLQEGKTYCTDEDDWY